MGIVRPVMESFPHAWMFFVPFILMATFTMLNLFIAVIVNTMQAMNEASHGKDREHIEAAVHAEGEVLDQEIRALRQELRDLKGLLETQRGSR
jgi:voltage-gated sodium channel